MKNNSSINQRDYDTVRTFMFDHASKTKGLTLPMLIQHTGVKKEACNFILNFLVTLGDIKRRRGGAYTLVGQKATTKNIDASRKSRTPLVANASKAIIEAVNAVLKDIQTEEFGASDISSISGINQCKCNDVLAYLCRADQIIRVRHGIYRLPKDPFNETAPDTSCIDESKKVICKSDSKPKVIFVDKVQVERKSDPLPLHLNWGFKSQLNNITKNYAVISESGEFISEHDTIDEATESAKHSLTMSYKILIVQVVRVVEVAFKLTEKQ